MNACLVKGGGFEKAYKRIESIRDRLTLHIDLAGIHQEPCKCALSSLVTLSGWAGVGSRSVQVGPLSVLYK